MSIVTPLPQDPRPVAVNKEARTYEVRIIVGRKETPVVIGSREEWLLDADGNAVSTPSRDHFVRRDFTTEFLAAHPEMVTLMATIASTMDVWEAEDVVAQAAAEAEAARLAAEAAAARLAAEAAAVIPPVEPQV